MVVVSGPKPPNPRMTITPPVIERARERAGAGERGGQGPGASPRALEGPLDASAVPAQLARDGTWIVDRDAARRLTAGR